MMLCLRVQSRVSDLREEEVSVLVARQHVVHQNRDPRAVFAQTHLIGSFCTQRASHHHLLHQLGTFSQDSQGTQEPVDRQEHCGTELDGFGFGFHFC